MEDLLHDTDRLLTVAGGAGLSVFSDMVQGKRNSGYSYYLKLRRETMSEKQYPRR